MTDGSSDPGVQVRIDGNDIHVTVTGDIDLSSTPALRARLEDALGVTVSRIVLDMSGVTFIDSTGLALLGPARATRSTSCRQRTAASWRSLAGWFNTVRRRSSNRTESPIPPDALKEGSMRWCRAR